MESVIGGDNAKPAQYKTPGGTAKNYHYQYEFSETRKVLDEFFNTATTTTSPATATTTTTSASDDLDYTLTRRPAAESAPSVRVGQRLATGASDFANMPHQPQVGASPLEPPLMSSLPPASIVTMSGASNGSGDTGYATLNSPEASRVAHAANNDHRQKASLLRGAAGGVMGSDSGVGGVSGLAGSTAINNSKNFTLSPETTDCDSADLESEVSINEGSFHSSGPRMHTAMPILEDGLSSGHASDLDEDVVYSR